MSADSAKSQLFKQSQKLQIPPMEQGGNLGTPDSQKSAKEAIDPESELGEIVNAEELESMEESLDTGNSQEIEKHLAELQTYIQDTISTLDNISTEFQESGYGKVKDILGDHLKIEGYNDLIKVSKTNGLNFKAIANHIDDNPETTKEVVGQIGEYDFLKKLGLVFEEYLGELEKLNKDLENRQNSEQIENPNENIDEENESERKSTDVENLIKKVKQLKTDFEVARLKLSSMFEDVNALDGESADKEMMDVMIDVFKNVDMDSSKIFDLCKETDPDIVERFLKERDEELKDGLDSAKQVGLGSFTQYISLLNHLDHSYALDQAKNDKDFILDQLIDHSQAGSRSFDRYTRKLDYIKDGFRAKFMEENKQTLSIKLIALFLNGSPSAIKKSIDSFNTIDPLIFTNFLTDNKDEIKTKVIEYLTIPGNENKNGLTSFDIIDPNFSVNFLSQHAEDIKNRINSNLENYQETILPFLDKNILYFKNKLEQLNKYNNDYAKNFLTENREVITNTLTELIPQQNQILSEILKSFSEIDPLFSKNFFDENNEIIVSGLIDKMVTDDGQLSNTLGEMKYIFPDFKPKFTSENLVKINDLILTMLTNTSFREMRVIFKSFGFGNQDNPDLENRISSQIGQSCTFLPNVY